MSALCHLSNTILRGSLSGAACVRLQSQLRAARPGGGAGGAAGDRHQEASQEQVTSLLYITPEFHNHGKAIRPLVGSSLRNYP